MRLDLRGHTRARGGLGRARLHRARRRARGGTPRAAAIRSRSRTCTTGCAARRPTPTRPRSRRSRARLGVPFAAERVAPAALREGGVEPRPPDAPGGRARAALRGARPDREPARRGPDRHRAPRRRPGRDGAAAPVPRHRSRRARRASRSARPTAGSCGRCCASRAPSSRATRARARSRGARIARTPRPTTRATGCARWLPALAREFNPRLLRAIADLAEAQRRDSRVDPRARSMREADARFTTEGSWLRIDAKDWGALPEALVAAPRARGARARGQRAARRAGAPRADRALPVRWRRRAGASSCPAVSSSAAIARASGSGPLARDSSESPGRGEFVC